MSEPGRILDSHSVQRRVVERRRPLEVGRRSKLFLQDWYVFGGRVDVCWMLQAAPQSQDPRKPSSLLRDGSARVWCSSATAEVRSQCSEAQRDCSTYSHISEQSDGDLEVGSSLKNMNKGAWESESSVNDVEIDLQGWLAGLSSFAEEISANSSSYRLSGRPRTIEGLNAFISHVAGCTVANKYISYFYMTFARHHTPIICARCLRRRPGFYKHRLRYGGVLRYSAQSSTLPQQDEAETASTKADGKEKEPGGMSKRLLQMAEESIEQGDRGMTKAIEEGGFSEELKRRLEIQIQDSSFKSGNPAAFAQIDMPVREKIGGHLRCAGLTFP